MQFLKLITLVVAGYIVAPSTTIDQKMVLKASNTELRVSSAVDVDIIDVADGAMPAKPIIDRSGITLVYGRGDSLMMVTGKDIRNLHQPILIARVPKMFSHAMRGPQAVLTDAGIVITVCTEEGNIYSFSKNGGKWIQSTTLNEAGSAKEGLMGMAGSGNRLTAIWLNVKDPKGQSLFASSSDDGGRSWKAPREIYNSPDGTICECCKPTIAQQGNQVYVMFRNWRDGNRDMYLLQSTDGGKSFSDARKIGTKSWALNGCPMDGGDLTINAGGAPVSVWRRASNLYVSDGTGNETLVAAGKNGAVETVGTRTAIAWTENGKVMVKDTKGVQQSLGAGALPLLKKLDDEHVLCIWQNEHRILAAIL